MRELAQFLDRLLDFIAEGCQGRSGVLVAARAKVVGGDREPNPHRCQGLLRAVVKILSDALSLDIARSHETERRPQPVSQRPGCKVERGPPAGAQRCAVSRPQPPIAVVIGRRGSGPNPSRAIRISRPRVRRAGAVNRLRRVLAAHGSPPRSLRRESRLRSLSESSLRLPFDTTPSRSRDLTNARVVRRRL